MKDPIQGALDAVREVEIRVGQIRLLWAEAERAKEAAEAEVKSLRARRDEDVERFRARAKQDRRDRFECGESLKAAHAAIWGLVCVATNMLHSAESATRDLKRLRRSNEQVREVLGANHGESPVEAAERAVLSRQNKEYMGREIERLRAEREKERAETAQLLQAERQALRESIAAVRAERDKALARVEELERLVPVEGGVRPMNACCYSARQVARNECASALFRILRPTKEPPQQGTYPSTTCVFNTALAEIIEEINALRKDREVLGANPGESPVEAAKRLRAEKDAMGREIERLRNERDVALARVVKLETACREGEQEVQALQESWSAVRAKRDKALARVEELEKEIAPRCSLRKAVRDECAAALFEVFRTSETLDTAFYGFAAALDVVAKELSALRKDREALNRVRSAVEGKP